MTHSGFPWLRSVCARSMPTRLVLVSLPFFVLLSNTWRGSGVGSGRYRWRQPGSCVMQSEFGSAIADSSCGETGTYQTI